MRHIFLILLFTGLQFGCGTLINVGNPVKPPSHGDQHLQDDNMIAHVTVSWFANNDKVVFGGVMNDLAVFTDVTVVPLGIPAIIDLPLSLGGDVITLPFTVYWTVSTEPPLTRAAELGFTDEVRSQLRSGANVNARNEQGRTPLMMASIHGHLEIVRMLLEHGADVQARDHQGETALMRAQIVALEDHSDITRTLLDHGARVNVQAEDGDTPLIIASQFCQVEAVRILLEHGADVSMKNERGYTALDMARHENTTLPDCSKVVELLKEHGAKK